MIGRIGLVEDAADFIADEKLGPDAIDRRFDFDVFKTAVRGLKRDVKSVLMDQEIVAGIGNIYSDEILFQGRINPAERIDKLTPGTRAPVSGNAQGPQDRHCAWRRLRTVRRAACPNATREDAALVADRS